MSTDFQTARIALGARLRELRTEAGLNGKDLAARLEWQRSKVSRLENGKQTAAPGDLEAWAAAVGAPDESADLRARLRALELQHQSWRRQLAAGHRSVQDKLVVEYQSTTTIRGYEASVIPGLFQTPDYARHLLQHNADLHGTRPDTEDAVRARMRRQEVLYAPGKSFRVLIWEARTACSDVPARGHGRAARQARRTDRGRACRTRSDPARCSHDDHAEARVLDIR